jgi:small subunit ribosomal protein S4
MGDPKFTRRKFERPTHPWIADRIREEWAIGKKYGLKSKRELWKVQFYLRTCRAQARSLQAKLRLEDEQAKKETSLLLRRLNRLGILKEGASSVDDVLALNIDTIMGRRLESIVFYKGLARSPKQSRQFITHGHIIVNGRRVTIPGYLVRKDEEDKIEFHSRSPLVDPKHPLRRPPEEVVEEKVAVVKEEKKPEAPKEGEAAPEAEKPKEAEVSPADGKRQEEKKPEEKKHAGEEKKKHAEEGKPDEKKHVEEKKEKKHAEEKKEKKGDDK